MKLATEAITNANAAQIVEQGRAAMAGGDFVIDFSAVVRCDTSAVACVLDWLRGAHAARRRLELVALPEDLLSLARLYNVEALITSR
jgi:phospholipid transport system transporter-binding protein